MRNEPLPDPSDAKPSVPSMESLAMPPLLTSESRQFVDSPNRPSLTPTPLERFLSGFFQEANIKWMLMIGAAIVTVCSLKLVAQQWHDWSVAFKYLSILLYVGAVAGFAHASDRFLGLRATSTVLKVLTLLLVPISFFSLGWLTYQSDESLLAFGPLVALGTAIGWGLSDGIFQKFFLGRQWTFQLSYLALGIAGAMPVLDPNSLWFAAVIWIVGTLGIIKSNRYIYWLTVEHRKPIMFAFFPTLLLGMQMALLFASKLSWIGHWEWLGFGLVLCAFPMAATTRSIALIHRAKTGGLLQVLPLPVIVPLLFSMVLGATGVILSFHGFRWGASTTYAVVPTVAIAASMAWFASYDTRHRGFTWIAIVLSLIAYQCFPSLVSDIAKSVIQNTAASLSEDRLPIPFYGLTYIPALLVLSLGSGWIARRNPSCDMTHVCVPMQHAATFISLFLLALSVFHFKACFLIPIAHAILFFIYAFVWRDRRYFAIAMGAIAMATGAWVPFANSLWGANLSIEFIPTSLGALSCLMIVLPVDRWISGLPIPAGKPLQTGVASGQLVPIALVMGGTIACGVTTFWCMTRWMRWGLPFDVASWSTFGFCLAANFYLTHRTRHYLAGTLNAVLLLFFGLSLLAYSAGNLSSLDRYTTLLTIVSMTGYTAVLASAALSKEASRVDWLRLRNSLGLDLQSLLFRRAASGAARPNLLRTVMTPLADIATIGVVGSLAIHAIGIAEGALLFRYDRIHWSVVAICVWLVFAIGITRSKIVTALSVGIAPVLVATGLQWSGLLPEDHRVSILVWTIVALLLGAIPYRTEQYFRCMNSDSGESKGGTSNSLTCMVPSVVSIWFLGAMTASLFPFSCAFQIAGVIAILGMWVLYQNQMASRSRTIGLIYANVLFYLLLFPWLDTHSLKTTFLDAGNFARFAWMDTLHTSAGCLFGVCVANIWCVKRVFHRLQRELAEVWMLIVLSSAAIMFIACFFQPAFSILSVVSIGYGLGYALFSLTQLARITGRERYVWGCFGVAALTGCLLWTHGCFFHVQGAAMFLIALLGVAMEFMGRWLREATNSGNWRVFGRPLCILGITCPIAISVVGAIAILSPLPPRTMQWLAFASLVSGFTSCIRSLSEYKQRYVWQTMLMWNISIALMTRSMGWTDVQFYMVPIGLSLIGLVEIMKKQIPIRGHKPLRIVGALVVLTSPVFEMLDGSWLHMFCLMVLSVLMVLIAIGLRVRILMFTGAAFLAADLLAMMVRSAIDRPNMLWVCGLGLGLGVIGIAALCEIYRERLLTQIRSISAELAQWS